VRPIAPATAAAKISIIASIAGAAALVRAEGARVHPRIGEGKLIMRAISCIPVATATRREPAIDDSYC